MTDVHDRVVGPLQFGQLQRLARIAAGARISFLVGLTVVVVSAAVGTALGSLAGYAGGALDDAISRAIDTLLAFPGLLLAIGSALALVDYARVALIFAAPRDGSTLHAVCMPRVLLREVQLRGTLCTRCEGLGLLLKLKVNLT